MEISTLFVQICQLKPELEMLALRYTSDIEDGDELVQKTLISGLYNAAEFPQSGLSLKKWLFQLMKETSLENNCIPMKIVYNAFDEQSVDFQQSHLEGRMDLEHMLTLFEHDLYAHSNALNSEQDLQSTPLANNG